ncbi:heterokaryon incompatibility protein-domain-containing protein [Chaetomium strumarium]|uniref:Heterokaryon incompatibility protein-domain-containing protein n=1 Tax=Chaetomium strumarium TaxID=1170767 RepID=A0AAJ0GQ75_9PEZI|nr:heterokaryon incompatibility protein-domain-containing protein [Chaetomium strumarium]
MDNSHVSPAVAPNGLCAYCQKVALAVRHKTFGGAYSLGTFQRVQTSDCPLCRIVLFCLYEYARNGNTWSRPDADKEVELQWTSDTPFRSPGFFYVTPYRDVRIGFLVDPHSDVESRNKYIHYLTPNLGKALDLQRVRKWVGHCEQNHGRECGSNSVDSDTEVADCYPGLGLMRFVDVEKMCIVEKQKVCRYVALSYVWGQAACVRLSTTNKAVLTKPEALTQYAPSIALTVRDATAFVRGIGERYLWVDSLCLVQNDPDDVRRGVQAMDLIYEKALLTVVAACGHDADAGLPGVKEGTRFMSRPSEEILPGVKLDAYPVLELLLKNSVYSTRAWTFQENILSRRCVYFVDNNVFFRCRKTTLNERFHSSLDEERMWSVDLASMLPGAVRMESSVEDYSTMLLYYSRRALTYQGDVLNAMAGIMRRVSHKMKCRFLEGLPTASLDLFLLFRSHRSMLRRREGFPSYSWAGWQGPVMVVDLPGDENKWLHDHTWIVWYKRSPRGVANLVWDPLANDSFPFHDDNYIGYREPRRPFTPPVALPFATTRTQAHGTVEVTALRSYPILQFWTLAVFFHLEIMDPIRGMAMVRDRGGTACGALYLDGLEGSTFFHGHGPFEMIAVSETVKEPWVFYDKWLEGALAWEAPDEFYHVLVLEWSGGLAERRAVGLVLRSAITRSCDPGPVWKEVLLA